LNFELLCGFDRSPAVERLQRLERALDLCESGLHVEKTRSNPLTL
jgi:hypothetical protein